MEFRPRAQSKAHKRAAMMTATLKSSAGLRQGVFELGLKVGDRGSAMGRGKGERWGEKL